jgi:hypothetical protein
MYGFDEWTGSGSWAGMGLLDTGFDEEVAGSTWEVPAIGKSGITGEEFIKVDMSPT